MRGWVGLLLNLLVWPGVGSIVARAPIGWAQAALFLLCGVLVATSAASGADPGPALLVPAGGMVGVWAWSVVTVVLVLREEVRPGA